MGTDEDQIDSGIEPQRVEVVEVGDTGIDEDGDAGAAIAASDAAVLQDHRVLGRQAMGVREERHQPQRRPAGMPGNDRPCRRRTARDRRGSG